MYKHDSISMENRWTDDFRKTIFVFPYIRKISTIVSIMIQNILLQEKKCLEAADLYYKHGTPAYQQNFNLYRRIILDAFSLRHLDSPESYLQWARLRTILLSLVRSISIHPIVHLSSIPTH